jgi:CBS domain-containing protein
MHGQRAGRCELPGTLRVVAAVHCASSGVQATACILLRDFPQEPTRQAMKKISEVMTGDVRVARPDDTIRSAAKQMAQADVGSLPVGENDRLIGMITDRDIVVRAVAEGRNDDTPVREVMTQNIRYCFEDEDVLAVARNMSELGVRRLPVLDRGKRLVGIVALSNIASGGTEKARDTLLEGVATPH